MIYLTIARIARYNSCLLRRRVTGDEKLNKVVRDFSLLPEEKQNYVLGIIQALAFADKLAASAEAIHTETRYEVTDEKREY